MISSEKNWPVTRTYVSTPVAENTRMRKFALCKQLWPIHQIRVIAAMNLSFNFSPYALMCKEMNIKAKFKAIPLGPGEALRAGRC